MRLLVFSDTHRRSSGMLRILSSAVPDVMIHLGDLVSDLEDVRAAFPSLRILSVPGNCDFVPDEVTETKIGGVRFFLCHGHQYGVKSGLGRLKAEAKKRDAGIVLFGHTHRACLEEEDGIVYLNPGTASGFGRLTYGEIFLDPEPRVFLREES
ncbi:MAG: metallophosphoesterase [Clostridia bacterium]|nr:metallophosphoesterase [Clostridia bacterium]